MRMLNIIPWVADEGLINYERQFLPSDVDVVGLKEGRLGECPSDQLDGLRALRDAVVDAERQGYDAVFVACFGDPGIELIRELVDIPVLGPLNVSLMVTGMIGHRACLLVPMVDRHFFLKGNVIAAAYGMEDRVVVRGGNPSVSEVFQAYEDYKASGGQVNPFISEMVSVCSKSIQEDEVDVIIIGCGALKWIKEILESELAKKGHSVTVINPLTTTAEIARALVNLKLSHNSTGYPKPPAVSGRYTALG